ncbi:4Fe-4S single cluster domain-containing protein [Dactylosporangium sucinum]|uniref:Radical SAM protein n=1 Tax=Dactylosporangium sucinum TaxID=1424081 RepID=A0A917X3F3_9ACTN|nr:4Fe-4S single cluster domain-containing protein [Dactylosporangium sucinum]GGM65515.1 radical SAM protein [Dactylosporangium sucinum]
MSDPDRTPRPAIDADQLPRPAADPGRVPLARFLPSTNAEGPGERTAIWVQGCSIRCPGCFNPHMWGFHPADPVATADLAARILATGTAGLTLLGGEPFDHAAPLAEVAGAVAEAGRSVMTFTGYTTAQLHRAVDQGRADVRALLDATDLLVAGPFLADRLDAVRPWVGSTNQEFLLLTDRFPEMLDALGETPDRLEITVTADGSIAVNGWADPATLEALLADLDARRGGIQRL